MSYRPDNQALEPAIDKILEGITLLNTAIIKRIESGEWNNDHIKEICELKRKFADLEIELVLLKQATW